MLLARSHLPVFAAGVGTLFNRLPRFQRAGPSTSLDKSVLTNVLTWGEMLAILKVLVNPFVALLV